MLYDGWSGLVRTVVVGLLAYAALVILVRVSGKRTLSKMNAFDLVVTVALGSTLATVLLSKDVALLEGVVAFALLVGLQLLITWLSTRSRFVSRLVKAEPRLLVYRGQLLRDTLRSERVVRAEILQALRTRGVAALQDAEAVVLETDGSFSVMSHSAHPSSALDDVGGWRPNEPFA